MLIEVEFGVRGVEIISKSADSTSKGTAQKRAKARVERKRTSNDNKAKSFVRARIDLS